MGLEQPIPPVSTPFPPGRRHSSGSEAPPKGSTLDKLIVDTYPVGCEAPPEGSTPVKLIMDEVKWSEVKFIRNLLQINLKSGSE